MYAGKAPLEGELDGVLPVLVLPLGVVGEPKDVVGAVPLVDFQRVSPK